MKVRKEMVECRDEVLGFKRKCELLMVPRGSMYYKPKMPSNNDEIIINELLDIHKETPSYGYRRKEVALRERGYKVNHKRVLSLCRKANICAIYPGKKTTIRDQNHRVYPYLLRGLTIDRPNQVWEVDITYIKIRGGSVYLICLIDVFSRKIMAWKLATSLDTASCLEALNNALIHYIPEIINSDQGCQFTSDAWVSVLKNHGIKISMDGKGRWADNIYIERFWRTAKYEEVYLFYFDTVEQARQAIGNYITFYNTRRYHSKLNYHTPDAVFYKQRIPTKQELFSSFITTPKIDQTREAHMF